MMMGYELGNAEERGLTGNDQSEWASSLLWAAIKEYGDDRLLFRKLGDLLAQNEPNPDADGQLERFLRDVGYMDARQRVMRREKKWGS